MTLDGCGLSATKDKTLMAAIAMTYSAPLMSVLQTPEERAVGAVEIARLIREVYWPAWREHPDYYASEWCDPFNPHAVAIYTHEPYEGHSESCMIAGLSDLFAPAQLKWGERTLGQFACVRPIPSEIPVHPTRICYISWSLKGSGKAFRCRMELKRFLPRRYHSLVSLARSCAKTQKAMHLSEWLLNERAGQHVNLKDRSALPAWYTSTTRDALNYARFLELAGDKTSGLETFITLDHFWQAATGHCDPGQVQNMVTHQMKLI